jgi:hypothetical protein
LYEALINEVGEMNKAYRPFKPGDKVYAMGPGLGIYVKDVGREHAEVKVDSGSYILSIYKIYETSEAEASRLSGPSARPPDRPI